MPPSRYLRFHPRVKPAIFSAPSVFRQHQHTRKAASGRLFQIAEKLQLGVYVRKGTTSVVPQANLNERDGALAPHPLSGFCSEFRPFSPFRGAAFWRLFSCVPSIVQHLGGESPLHILMEEK
jgi:hypothetical protein